MSDGATPSRPRAKKARNYDQHRENCNAIRSVVSTLRLTRLQDEHTRIALVRLENWLVENDESWTAS